MDDIHIRITMTPDDIRTICRAVHIDQPSTAVRIIVNTFIDNLKVKDQDHGQV